MIPPEPIACACIIVLAMSAAGVVHTLWMRSAWSARFALPIDAGTTWRGRRVFGRHKTIRGFLALVPAAGATFGIVALVRDSLPGWWAAGIWDVSAASLIALGAWAGFCFMAGELPNSFYKRRLGIEPGCVPQRGWSRALCLVADRIDSTLAVLAGLWLWVPVPWLTWGLVLLLGSLAHFGFSAVLYCAGVKTRFA